MIVQDVMTRNPVYVTNDVSLREVIDKLYELDFRHLPVLSDGELVGIVSDRDVRQYTLPPVDEMLDPDRAAARLDQPVASIMHGSPVTVEPETELSEVVQIFIEEKVGAVPVVDEHSKKLVGIISYVDVLKALYTGEGPLATS